MRDSLVWRVSPVDAFRRHRLCHLRCLSTLSTLDSSSSTLCSLPCPPVPSGMSGDSVGASGRRLSSPVAPAGSSDGLAGSVISMLAGWSRDALVVDVLPWSRVALASSGSRTVSPMLPSLACPMHSLSNYVLWGRFGVTVVASSSLDSSVRRRTRALDVLRRPVSMRGRLRCRHGHLGCSVRRDPSYELPRL